MAELVSTATNVVLLTGADCGIGNATVECLSSAGWRVLRCARHAFPENYHSEGGATDFGKRGIRVNAV